MATKMGVRTGKRGWADQFRKGSQAKEEQKIGHRRPDTKTRPVLSNEAGNKTRRTRSEGAPQTPTFKSDEKDRRPVVIGWGGLKTARKCRSLGEP